MENNSASLVQDPTAGWYVQLAASNSGSEASDLGKKLKARGLSPTIQKTKVKNVMYSRVLVGPYPNRVAALDDQQKIKSWGISKGEPFLRYLSD
jgi:cell division septation protein DedD